MAPGAQREREGFGEAAGPHGADLERVHPVAVLVALGGAERVGAAVQVEAGQLGEPEPFQVLALVEDGVGLRADDLDVVPEPGEFAGQMAYVDALSAAERVPLVRKESDAQRTVTVGGGTGPGARLHGLSGHSWPPSRGTFTRDYAWAVI